MTGTCLGKRTALGISLGVALLTIFLLVGCSSNSFEKTKWYSVQGGSDSFISFADAESWNGSIEGTSVSGSWSQDEDKVVLNFSLGTMLLTTESRNGEDVLVYVGKTKPDMVFFKTREASLEHEKTTALETLASMEWKNELQPSGLPGREEAAASLSFTSEGAWTGGNVGKTDYATKSLAPLFEGNPSGSFSIEIGPAENYHNQSINLSKGDWEGSIDFKNGIICDFVIYAPTDSVYEKEYRLALCTPEDGSFHLTEIKS